MAEVECEFVSSASELGDPPELNGEPLALPEWPKRNGKGAKFLMCELTTGEHDRFDLSDKVFDKFGNIIRIERGLKQYEFLALCTRDGDRQRIWQSAEACKATLEAVGKGITNKMLVAANKVNYGDDSSSAEEAEASAEGKSGEA